MDRILHSITGSAADVLPRHAIRGLFIERQDHPGGGSAVADDEEDDVADKTDILDDEDFREEDLDDEQPRGKRTEKQVQAYDKLKSDRDKLQQRLAERDRELTDLRERVQQIESVRESRDDVNVRTNASLDRAKQRAREVIAEIRKLDKSDPEYSEKVYEAMFSRVYADHEEAARAISRETSMQVTQETRSMEQRQQDAERAALAELERVGLGPENLRLVKMVAREKDETWFRATPKEEQVGRLVEEAADMLKVAKRGSQDFQADKKRHREAMDGVIDSSANRTTRRSVQDDEETQEGPGSMLADWKRLRTLQQKNTNLMLRNRDR